MKHIRGFICLGILENKRRIPFGKSVNEGKQSFETFFTNDLTPYDTVFEALLGKFKLEGFNGIARVEIFQIDLRIAETREEFYKFKNRSNLVLIMFCTNPIQSTKRIWGEGQARAAMPGVDFIENDFHPFKSFARAEHVASEINRQGQAGVQIASLFLTPIEDS